MKKKIAPIPFKGTEKQKTELLQFIESHKSQKGCAMPILQKAQSIYGYIPFEVQSLIAAELGVPIEKLFGISTFYSQFALTPKGEYDISVCLGTACYVKGSGEILEAISKKLNLEPESITEDGKFSLTACRCIGACGLAPVMTINGEVYGKLTVEKAEKILDKYLEFENEGGIKN